MTADYRPDTSRGFTDLKRMVSDDGPALYMCQLCFEYFTFDQLADSDDPAFAKTDVCTQCESDDRAKVLGHD